MKRGLLLFACIFILVVSATGCLTRRQSEAVSHTTNEEVQTIERYVSRDTVVFAPPSNSTLDILLADLIAEKQFTSRSDNSQVTVRYIPETKSIEANCECDSVSIVLQLMDRYFSYYRSKTEVTESEVTKDGHNWKTSLVSGGIAAIATAGILGLIKFIKS
ncbi:MAG: hypothetical protein H6606_06030 [Flavobacteriales bacterium]|nr:hypothetical protein [Flavobacteriales bacterium]